THLLSLVEFKSYFVGIFFQLSPVANTSYGDTGKYCFQSKYFKSMFPNRVILKETIRQNEESFIKAINEISHGKSSQESEQFILELSRPITVQEGSRSVKLFSRNDYSKRSCQTYCPRLLWIKKSCPVILLRNLSKTLVNGLSGYVSEVDDSGLVINFPSVNLVTRIPKVKFTVYSQELNKGIAVREQYLLKLGFGITIHKAQGMTLTSVEVDCRDIFKAGQLAVAISRATASSGLRVINFHPRYIIPPPQSVMEFMNEPSQATTPDISCCRAVKSLTCDDDSDFKETTEFPEDNEDQPQIEDVDVEATEDIENLDGVPEACLAKYYRLSHEFTTSADYTLSCIDLFGDECFFSDHQRIVCYNIVEAVRLFYLKQKVDLLKITKGNIPKRQVTDASEANFTVSILNTLKEEENYLKANTNEPESLLDVERRQYSSRGLTNVTDILFTFFVKLTEECMAVFVHENLMTFGKSMYKMCLDHIMRNQSLYPLFISVVVNSCSMAGVVEFDEDQDIDSILEKMVLISSQTCSIFNELIQKYLMVLLSQFRKNFKSSLRVEKNDGTSQTN
ncbi:PIF1-like protein, partial [Mya arenaria]